MSHTLFGPSDWERLPSREFADWCNQLEGLRSPVLVGTCSRAGRNNLAIFNSLTHIGARPPLLALVFRPMTVERHTYENIRERGTYTINHVSRAMIERAHATSAKHPREISEFEAVGLTPVLSGAGVPYVAESAVSLQLRFEEEHHVAANDTVIVIGRVEEFRLGDGSHFEDRPINWEGLDATVVNGLYNYYGLFKDRKMEYAESDRS